MCLFLEAKICSWNDVNQIRLHPENQAKCMFCDAVESIYIKIPNDEKTVNASFCRTSLKVNSVYNNWDGKF